MTEGRTAIQPHNLYILMVTYNILANDTRRSPLIAALETGGVNSSDLSNEPNSPSANQSVLRNNNSSSIKNDIKGNVRSSFVSEFDEMPVTKNTKTFEEMLAEKLIMEEQAITNSPINSQKQGIS